MIPFSYDWLLHLEFSFSLDFSELTISTYFWFGFFGILLIIFVITLVMVVILSHNSPTYVNCFILGSCLLKIANIPAILWQMKVPLLNSVCAFRVVLAYSINMANRMIPIGIAFYRWIYANNSGLLMTCSRRKCLNLIITTTMVLTMASLTWGAITYKGQNTYYNKCTGQTKNYSYNYSFDLPITHPFHLASYLTFFSNVLIAPILYSLIFWRLWRQNLSRLGLSGR